MKIFGYELSKTKPDQIGTEKGTSAKAGVPTMFAGEVEKWEGIQPEDFVMMRKKDGTVAAMVKVLTMPILGNPWTIEPEDDTPEAKAQAEFVLDALTRPPHKGGMTVPFNVTLADMLRALSEGYRVFEKVFEIREDKIVFQKIATRDISTVTINQDGRGGFDGFTQRAFIDNKYAEVKIPKEYAFLFTYNRAANMIYGESMLTAAYYHYVIKHKLYYLANQGAEVGINPPKVATAAKGANETAQTATQKAINQLGVRSSVVLPDGWKLEGYKSGDKVEPLPLIDHHNSEMSRSILAQFMMLGSGENAVGSWALSKDQSDMFTTALRSVMREIEDHITSYLIPDLIDYNFAVPKYPRFSYANITDATVDLLKEVVLKIIDKPDSVPDSLYDGVIDKLATHLGVDVTEKKNTGDHNSQDVKDGASADAAVAAAGTEIQKQALNGAQISSLLSIVKDVVAGLMPYDAALETIKASFPALDDTTINKILEPTKGFTPAGDGKVVNNSKRISKEVRALSRRTLAEGTWFRDLTPVEDRVNFSAIQEKQNSLEDAYKTEADAMFKELEAKVMKDVEALLEAGDASKFDAYKVEAPEGYEALLLNKMIDAYNHAKKGAADELNVGAPKTPDSSKEVVKQNAAQIVEKQIADLNFQVHTVMTEAVRKNMLKAKTEFAVADVLKTLSAAWATSTDNFITGTAGVIFSSMLNLGRGDVFADNEDKIESYQYSAILDETTCPTCEDLDGSVVSPEDYAKSPWIPPIHFGCRCIWVAILKEDEQPDITGFPDAPGDKTAPDLSETAKLARELGETRDKVAILTEAFSVAFTAQVAKEISDDSEE